MISTDQERTDNGMLFERILLLITCFVVSALSAVLVATSPVVSTLLAFVNFAPLTHDVSEGEAKHSGKGGRASVTISLAGDSASNHVGRVTLKPARDFKPGQDIVQVTERIASNLITEDWLKRVSQPDGPLNFVVPEPRPAARLQHGRPADSSNTPSDKLQFAVPVPRLAARQKPGPGPVGKRVSRHARTKLVTLGSAPFPYDGKVPGSGHAFLNFGKDGRRAHRTPSGRIYWMDQTYNDRRSLVHIPKQFDPDLPGVLVLFFHGHGATLTRDVWNRQRVPAQVSSSGMNAVLVAPQFAVDASDSSIGKFWMPGHLHRYLEDVSEQLAVAYGDPETTKLFAKLPVIIVGYSGGYVPAAYALAQGGIHERIRGVVLLDAIYGHARTFAKWIERSSGAFFVSANARYTRRGQDRLRQILDEKKLEYQTELPDRLTGETVLLSTNAIHQDYVTHAWTDNPVSDILRRVDGLAMPGRNKTIVIGAAVH